VPDSIKALQQRVLQFAEERDWMQFHAPKNLSMAIAAEAAELMEHYLWADAEASHTLTDDAAKRDEVEQELADVLILTLQMANVLNIDLPAAVDRKMSINAAKYPIDRAKGTSAKYTDL